MIRIKRFFQYCFILIKWIVVASLIGLIGGVVGSLFHISIDYVTEQREHNLWLICLLPLGGIVIAFLYNLCKGKGTLDTNCILNAVSGDEKVPFVLAPLIFVSSVITHLFGGSAGREGAALQLGGSIGYNVGHLIRFKKDDIHISVMSGMSAVFAALFGTPLTASIFALEVARVGIMRYSAFVPCVVSAFVASTIAKSFGLSPVNFGGVILDSVTALSVVKIIILAVLCAFLSVLFCTAIKQSEKSLKKAFPNRYMRSFVGGLIIVILAFIFRTTEYNGAGMDVITRAIYGEARYEAFLLKILFTAITIAAGFKGGEIVPAFFVGSTFGCVAGGLLGLDASFSAAIGFVAVFCGVVNCPIASLFLALEVFGSENLLIFALVCGISYMMSGHSGLYKAQNYQYPKI